jgi:hypothetical protein
MKATQEQVDQIKSKSTKEQVEFLFDSNCQDINPIL